MFQSFGSQQTVTEECFVIIVIIIINAFENSLVFWSFVLFCVAVFCFVFVVVVVVAVMVVVVVVVVVVVLP